MGLEGQNRFVRMQAENGAKNCKCVTLLEKSEVKDAVWLICSDQIGGGEGVDLYPQDTCVIIAIKTIGFHKTLVAG
jgi:hypothetical protein